LEHHYCGDQQWCSLTKKLNPPSAFVYFRWSWFWSCYFGLGLGLKNLVLFTSLPDYHQNLMVSFFRGPCATFPHNYVKIGYV